MALPSLRQTGGVYFKKTTTDCAIRLGKIAKRKSIDLHRLQLKQKPSFTIEFITQFLSLHCDGSSETRQP